MKNDATDTTVVDQTTTTSTQGATEEETGGHELVTEELGEEKTQIDFHPFDEEAWAWVNEQIAPLAAAPIFYIGYGFCMKIARTLGRPLVLLEAQYLVQLDGPLATCAVTQTQFQPVKFACAIPKDIVEQTAAGKFLCAGTPQTQIEVPFCGCYYLDRKLDLYAVSGPLFKYDGRQEDYVFDHRSPLGMMAIAFRQQGRRRKFGDCHEMATQNKLIRAQRLMVKNRVWDLANSIPGAPRQNNNRQGRR